MRRLEEAFRVTDKKCALKEEELPRNITVNNGYNNQLNFLLNCEIKTSQSQNFNFLMVDFLVLDGQNSAFFSHFSV